MTWFDEEIHLFLANLMFSKVITIKKYNKTYQDTQIEMKMKDFVHCFFLYFDIF